jgi:hypothetical protein
LAVPSRRAFSRATASASGDESAARTRARGRAWAIAIAVLRQARERELDQGFCLRPRNEHRRRDDEGQSPEFTNASEVGDRLAVAAAARQRKVRVGLIGAEHGVVVGDEPRAVAAQHLRKQYLGVQRHQARLCERPAHRYGIRH